MKSGVAGEVRNAIFGGESRPKDAQGLRVIWMKQVNKPSKSQQNPSLNNVTFHPSHGEGIGSVTTEMGDAITELNTQVKLLDRSWLFGAFWCLLVVAEAAAGSYFFIIVLKSMTKLQKKNWGIFVACSETCLFNVSFIMFYWYVRRCWMLLVCELCWTVGFFTKARGEHVQCDVDEVQQGCQCYGHRQQGSPSAGSSGGVAVAIQRFKSWTWGQNLTKFKGLVDQTVPWKELRGLNSCLGHGYLTWNECITWLLSW